MSSVETVVALRFELGKVPSTGKALLDAVTKAFGKKPHEFYYIEKSDEVGDIMFDPKKNDGFQVHIVGKSLFADYIIEQVESDANLNIPLSKIEKGMEKAKKRGFDKHKHYLKVVSYHNGGCAGLCEIK